LAGKLDPFLTTSGPLLDGLDTDDETGFMKMVPSIEKQFLILNNLQIVFKFLG